MVVRRTALVALLALGLGACGGARSDGRVVANAKAQAVPIAAVKPAVKKADSRIADRVFNFGDAFAALDYQLSFTSDARNSSDADRACAAINASHAQLENDLSAVGGKAGEVATHLLAATRSAVTACSQSLSAVDDGTAEAVHLDFGAFREMALDFASLLSPSA